MFEVNHRVWNAMVASTEYQSGGSLKTKAADVEHSYGQRNNFPEKWAGQKVRDHEFSHNPSINHNLSLI